MADPWWMPVWKEMVRNVDKPEYREIIQHVSKLEKLLQENDAEIVALRRRLAAALRGLRKEARLARKNDGMDALPELWRYENRALEIERYEIEQKAIRRRAAKGSQSNE